MKTFEQSAVDLNGKGILVTGGTGSFGQRFVQRVCERYVPERLIVFSRDETKQYEMALRFPTDRYPFIRYFIGDVRDADRLELALHGVEYLVHAAALKHVPTAEYNPFECIRTNVHGAENVVKAALGAGVRRVLALSTDKAVNPINLYGASKLASDKIFVAANNLSGREESRFSVVRYGNVVGSRGSVVPLYQRLIAEGADRLPVTDSRMTRFWISLDQGVDFVLSSLDQMVGGEIHVPKIPSMRITDLARALAPDLPHEVVGIRPGEKLAEVLITEDDARYGLDLSDRYVIEPSIAFWSRERSTYAHGRALAEEFRYASDSNDEWLDVESLRGLLESDGS